MRTGTMRREDEETRASEYVCGSCGAVNVIKAREQIRCGACAYRVMYKPRTAAEAVYLAR